MKYLMLLLSLMLIGCNKENASNGQEKDRISIVEENIEKLDEKLLVMAEQVPLNKWWFDNSENEFFCQVGSIKISIGSYVNGYVMWTHTKEQTHGLTHMNVNQENRISNLYDKLNEPAKYERFKNEENTLNELIKLGENK